MATELFRERLANLFEFFKAVEGRRMHKDLDVTKHGWVMWPDLLPIHNKLNRVKLRAENRADYRFISDLSNSRRS